MMINILKIKGFFSARCREDGGFCFAYRMPLGVTEHITEDSIGRLS